MSTAPMSQTSTPLAQMSLKAAFAPCLPFLRRHARGLAGDQKSGDAYVRATLEALTHAPETLDSTNPAAVELFRLFHAFWSPNATALDAGLPERLSQQLRGDVELQRLPPRRRAALLLHAVEGFALPQVATILALSIAEAEADVAAARAEIDTTLQSRVLVIEDESLIALHLETILTDIGHTPVGVAGTRAEAVTTGRATAPDLILADIQLADGSSGIDAVKELLQERDVPVIFITAYPERLLTGERPEPTWLITKPFEPETVAVTIGQALLQHRGQTAD